MRAVLALLCVVLQAQRLPSDDYLRAGDPCRPNNCVPPQICIRVKCDAGLCPQCTMTTFSNNPADDLPGLGPAVPTSAAQSPTPVQRLPPPTPFDPSSQLISRNPVSPSPGLVARNPVPTVRQPVSYPYVDPPTPPQLVSRPTSALPTPSVYSSNPPTTSMYPPDPSTLPTTPSMYSPDPSRLPSTASMYPSYVDPSTSSQSRQPVSYPSYVDPSTPPQLVSRPSTSVQNPSTSPMASSPDPSRLPTTTMYSDPSRLPSSASMYPSDPSRLPTTPSTYSPDPSRSPASSSLLSPGAACSLSGVPGCLPPAQCVYIGNPFKPENANLNLLFCVAPGQDTSGLQQQLQLAQQARIAQQAQTQAPTPSPPQFPQPQRLPQSQQQPLGDPQTQFQQAQQQLQLAQQQYQQAQQQYQQAQQQYQAQQAQMLQLQVAAPSSSPCCRNSSNPGCPSDRAAQACVCGLDSFCCQEMWDGGCVELASRACSVQCQPQCDGQQTCGQCVAAGCRWRVPPDGSSGSCGSSCSGQAGWNCHTSSCPDPCLFNPCPSGQQCSISNACAQPPCFSCSSQPSLKPGTCPAVSDCDVDYDSSECSVDSQCEGSSKCCLQTQAGGFVIQASVRSFGTGRKSAKIDNGTRSDRRAFSTCQWQCMLPNVQCATSGDCALGQYCSNSQCNDFVEEGMPCSSRTRCLSPLSCIQGSCRRALQPTPARPTAQPACSVNDDCGSSMFCQPQAQGGSVCQAFRTEGLQCGEPTWKCLSPLVCLAQGVCRAPDYCANDADCPQSARCVSNKCTPAKQDCCTANPGGMGCSDPAVEACVCSTDSSCCSLAWDKTCAKAAEQCGASCKSAVGLWVAPGFGVDPCCGLQKIGGCGDISVDGNCACQVDNFCCDNTWDYKCINIASQKCGLTCPSGT